MNAPSRLCPSCGGRRRSRIYRQEFEASRGTAVLDGYDVVACRRCGLCFADRIPSQRELDRYYEKLSKYEHRDLAGAVPELLQPVYRYYADVASRFLRDRSRPILEIGCATGALLAQLQAMGHGNLRGLDPSPYCSEAARKLYGIRVDIGSLFGSSWRTPKSAMIIMVGVLEHVRSLRRCLFLARSALTPGGAVVVVVPDAGAFAEVALAPFQQFSVEHIAFFTRRSLRDLMARAGFRELWSERTLQRESETSAMPVITGVYRIGRRSTALAERDPSGEKALRHYVEESQSLDDGLSRRLKEATARNRRVIVWGVGTHTLRLLRTGALRPAEIAAFIDSNSNYHGQHLKGVAIHPPSFVKTSRLPVLISSHVFQTEIERQIRNDLECSNAIIRLYDV